MRPDWENECVSKSALIEWLRPYLHTGEPIPADVLISDIQMMPPTFTPQNEAMTLEMVAEILAEQFGDECACNVNGNDEWLPMMCYYGDVCPDPPEHLGCWMELLRNKYRRPPEGGV